jgi:hypothetical protein
MIEARSQVQIHALHLVLFAIWLAVFGLVWLRAKLSGRAAAAESPTRSAPWSARLLGLPGAIALSSAVAGGVHLSIIDEHFREAVLYGAFFLGLTIAQFAFSAAVVWRPSRELLLAGGCASLAVVLLWLATRTTGIPLGPAAGETEPFGSLDIVASIAELITAALCGVALFGRAVTQTQSTTGSRRSSRSTCRRAAAPVPDR